MYSSSGFWAPSCEDRGNTIHDGVNIRPVDCRMMFFGGTFGIATIIALIRHFLKGRPFEAGAFIGQAIIIWFIVMAAAVVLFLGWCFLALSSIHGPIN